MNGPLLHTKEEVALMHELCSVIAKSLGMARIGSPETYHLLEASAVISFLRSRGYLRTPSPLPIRGEVDELKQVLAEIGNIANGIRASDGAPRGYSHDYFNDLVDRIHAACDGDCLTYSWKKPTSPTTPPDALKEAGKVEVLADRIRTLEEALSIAVRCLNIASDWGAPNHYDIELPSCWEDVRDETSSEPTWAAAYLLVPRLERIAARQALADKPQETEGVCQD